MSEITVTRRVAAPADRVWEVFTDLEHAPDRLSGVTAVEVLTPGPFGPGTRWRETRVMYGKEATEEMTVAETDPPRGYVVTAESHGARYRSEFRFTPSGDGTDVAMTFGGQPTSLVSRVLGAVTMPLMKRSVTKALTQDLVDLAAACEAGAA
jgi:carbon monoxide dehydrogenase subunit G